MRRGDHLAGGIDTDREFLVVAGIAKTPKPAGVRWHAIVSLKDDVPFADRLTGQRPRDSVGLRDAALATAALTLFDLRDLDVDRFIGAIEQGAHLLTRLKTNHNHVVLPVHTGKGDRVTVRGMRLDDAGALDRDAQLEAYGMTAKARVVAELAPGGECHWYLTSVGRELEHRAQDVSVQLEVAVVCSGQAGDEHLDAQRFAWPSTLPTCSK